MRATTLGSALIVVGLLLSLARVARAEDEAGVTLASLAWLQGDWRGQAFGGEIQEVWLAPAGGMMHGVFRLEVDGRVRISEYLQIAEEESGVLMRFAHFRPDYSTVEAAGTFLELRLAIAGDGHARFEATGPESPDRIEYRRQSDGSVQVDVTGVESTLVMRRVP